VDGELKIARYYREVVFERKETGPVSDCYSAQHVQVRPRAAGHAPAWVSFTGRVVSHIPGKVREDAEEQSGQDFTLYKTPDEGLKLHVQEWTIQRRVHRRIGERPAELYLLGGALYSEAEAKQTYPEIFEALVELARD
jgi:hypothetical protein